MTGSAHSNRIRLGMVGGGQGAFIGAVHRLAARIDGRYDLVAGALSSTPERARASAAELGLAPERAYASFAEMAAAEAAREDGIEAVAIVTPNHVHAAAAAAFLNAGIHVICDKPMTLSVAEAEGLVELVETSGKLFVLTHNYTGYPMIRQARAMVRDGVLGEIRLVQAEYPQDWLTERAEAEGSKQAEWRTDPARSGAGGAIGDIGTHAMNLASFVSGLRPRQLCAELTSFVQGRKLDDDVQILIRYEGGAKGMLWASQVAPGNENGLRLRVYGTKGGLDWHQEDPNVLTYSPFGEPARRITRGGAGSGPEAARLTRVPAGHPEGYLEGFGNIYSEAASAILAARAGEPVPADVVYPTVRDGLDGMRFIEAAVRSSKAGGVWTEV
ncbi:Gfo/Idh/MocA family protein [Solirhodobacter olei]|uniref:Gfo/Idh/MocA family protein n=1 Tax=Solirhodobacter olei TaxID=2493082 RepID=UPI0019D43B25|nr:Gfo/Idh/MocA family oxidoreductase [Solirhodobacter olei]